LARNPLHFGALSGMAQIHIRLGDMEAALQAYRRALAVNPRLPDAQQNLRYLEEAAREQRRAAGGQRT
jgi:cytochrome c-type biogenesis protein CcmH/NrfG